MTTIYTRTIGHQRIDGADVPVTIEVRQQRRQWAITRMCNGIGNLRVLLPTKREAVAYAMAYQGPIWNESQIDQARLAQRNEK